MQLLRMWTQAVTVLDLSQEPIGEFHILHTSALALCFSVAERCAPIWLYSSHMRNADFILNDYLRLISDLMNSTSTHLLPVMRNPVSKNSQADDTTVQQGPLKHIPLPTSPQHNKESHHREARVMLGAIWSVVALC